MGPNCGAVVTTSSGLVYSVIEEGEEESDI